MPDGTSRFTAVKNGALLWHFMGCSTFSQYTVVSEISICKVDQKAPLDKICLLGCGIPTGYGAVLNTCKVEPNSSVAVWGLGAVGMAVIMGAKKAGARQIVGIDLKESKFDVGGSPFMKFYYLFAARKFGATDFVNPATLPEGKSMQEYLVENYDGGFDYTFECVGNPATMVCNITLCENWLFILASSSRVCSQGMGCLLHHRSCRSRTGNIDSSLPAGHWKNLEGNSFRRMEVC